MNIKGGGIEIDVFQGAYLSFLAESTDRTWAGLDVFVCGQRKIAQENIYRIVKIANSESEVSLLQTNTQALNEESFAKLLSDAGIEEISFASIDGDHSSAGVYHDLKLVESRLSPGGIIVMDDIFSSMSGSCSEEFFRYMFGETSLKPIVFSDNKLFLTTTGRDELYQIRCMVDFNTSEGICGQRWRDGSQVNRVRPFLGARLMNV
jgi:hypothetical protein